METLFLFLKKIITSFFLIKVIHVHGKLKQRNKNKWFGERAMKSKISPSGLTPQSGGPILGTILTLRGHCQCLKTFWMSQLGEGGCCCKYLAESSRVAAKHCAMHRMAPMTRNYSAQSVLCASVERPWPGVTTTSYALHILPENLKYIFFTNFCLHN